MLSRSGTEKSPDTARTHCCPKVRLMNQSSHRYTSMQFNQRVPTCVAVLSNSTASAPAAHSELCCPRMWSDIHARFHSETLQMRCLSQTFCVVSLMNYTEVERSMMFKIRHALFTCVYFITQDGELFHDERACSCKLGN